jgi:hypothetical protein
MKTFVGLVRDHSVSMFSLRKGAINDYNATITGIKESIAEDKHDALVSVVECGAGYSASASIVESNTPIQSIGTIGTYNANGRGTPLWDSVGLLITQLEASARLEVDKDVAMLVMVITDGYENASKHWTASSLAKKIIELQSTDKWTFVFRVPRGHKTAIVNLGIPYGNVIEWDQTESAMAQATTSHVAATKSYFSQRSQGVTSKSTFYVDLDKVSKTQVKAALVDISGRVNVLTVGQSDAGTQIRDFVQKSLGQYKIGHAFYQLTKSEKVQDYKRFILLDKADGKMYDGLAARQLLGLPDTGEVRVSPTYNQKYDLFIQSTSVNRKLVPGTKVLYAP